MSNLTLNSLSGPEQTGPARRTQGIPNRDSRFSGVLSETLSTRLQVQVRQGDTLIGLVKDHYQRQGLVVSDNEAYRQALQLAARNGIANPDRIRVGQQVDLASLEPPVRNITTPGTDIAGSAAPGTTAPGTTAPGRTAPARPATWRGGMTGAHPVLEKTLERAIDKGFMPATQKSQVYRQILGLADRYGFEPDDFARLTLIESGGMNPQASNGLCHGIIQFCEGPQRGAATVGHQQNPRAILQLDLPAQLDLVDRYFAENQLQDYGPRVSLDDLYLTVLNPSARGEKRRDVPLNIGGPQASYLHVGQNTSAPITRNSIVSGLRAFSEVLLGAGPPASRAALKLYADSAPG